MPQGVIREISWARASGLDAARRLPAVSFIALSVLLALTELGCSKSAPSRGASASDDGEALTAVLVAADRADGTEDKVVARCAVCGLGMDGSAEITGNFAGYTFHFCTAECRELFQRHPGKVLARLDLPSPAAPAP